MRFALQDRKRVLQLPWIGQCLKQVYASSAWKRPIITTSHKSRASSSFTHAQCPIAQVLHIHHTLTHSYAQTYNTLEFQALEIHTQHTNHNIVRTNLDSFWLKCLEDVQTVGLLWEDQRYRWCWWSLFELTSMTMNVTWLTLGGSPMLGSTSLLSGLGLAPPLVLVLKLLVKSWLLSLLLMLFALLVVVGVDANRVSNSSTIFTWRKSFKSLPWESEKRISLRFYCISLEEAVTLNLVVWPNSIALLLVG